MIPFKKKFSGAPGECLDLHETILRTEGPGVPRVGSARLLGLAEGRADDIAGVDPRTAQSLPDDTDMLQQWIDAHCEINPKGWMWLKEAHSSYTQFLKDENF